MRRAAVGKLLGVAGLVGVAATGAVLARDERQRRAHTPDDVRARLHQRARILATAGQFAEERGESAPELVAVPTGREEGLWFVPRATTRWGRFRQRTHALRQRLPVLRGR